VIIDLQNKGLKRFPMRGSTLKESRVKACHIVAVTAVALLSSVRKLANAVVQEDDNTIDGYFTLKN